VWVENIKNLSPLPKRLPLPRSAQFLENCSRWAIIPVHTDFFIFQALMPKIRVISVVVADLSFSAL